MKTLSAILLLLSLSLANFTAFAEDHEGPANEMTIEESLDQEKSTTKWEEENKFLVESTRTTSSINEQDSDQVEYEVIEQ
ncbi:MAG: hypothetical protein A2X86_01310 [Bdellovibrionales bacterium GWA2_49_15]|nr:MAG: hypothetical protein A2X86_01310 [Bdellovibrionales bacterium GWA2_49_15]